MGGSGVFPVTVRLMERSDGIRPGLGADVRLEFVGSEEAPEGFKVPVSAIGEDRGGRFVYLAEEKGEGTATVRRRTVETGDIDSSGVSVVSGLEEGERVITAGVSRIDDGLVVKLPPPGQP